MAPSNRRLVCCCLIVAASLAHICSGGSADVKSDSEPKKVSLDLYYESLCPYSANFIVNELTTIFRNGLIDIVDLNLFPWGNAKLRPDNSFTCQHGPAECLLNTVEACAIDAWPSLGQHFPFIYCVEKLAYEGKYTLWETCFQQLGLDPRPVTGCYSSGLGKKLELKYAAETESLQPPHTYVPWVVVDGQPLYEDYENFASYVCKAYKGPTPRACADESFKGFPEKIAKHPHRVSYTDEEAKEPTLLTKVSSLVRSRVLWVFNRAVNL